jgi:hypothetical protein
MTRRFFMTLITWIIFVTTFEFYSNDVKCGMIMLAAGMIIYQFPIYVGLVHNAFAVLAAKVRNDLRKKKFL